MSKIDFTPEGLNAGVFGGSLLKARKQFALTLRDTESGKYHLRGAAGERREFRTDRTGGAVVAIHAQKFVVLVDGQDDVRDPHGALAISATVAEYGKVAADWCDLLTVSAKEYRPARPLITDCTGEFAVRIEFRRESTLDAIVFADVYVNPGMQVWPPRPADLNRLVWNCGAPHDKMLPPVSR